MIQQPLIKHKFKLEFETNSNQNDFLNLTNNLISYNNNTKNIDLFFRLTSDNLYILNSDFYIYKAIVYFCEPNLTSTVQPLGSNNNFLNTRLVHDITKINNRLYDLDYSSSDCIVAKLNLEIDVSYMEKPLIQWFRFPL